MNLLMDCTHPDSRKEVMGMDDASCDVDVNVACVSINITSNLKERMSDHD
jgi:hypothetical protein